MQNAAAKMHGMEWQNERNALAYKDSGDRKRKSVPDGKGYALRDGKKRNKIKTHGTMQMYDCLANIAKSDVKPTAKCRF